MTFGGSGNAALNVFTGELDTASGQENTSAQTNGARAGAELSGMPPGQHELLEFGATSAQTYYWRRNSRHPGDPCLNIAARWRIEGPVQIDRMERAWQAITDRHEILRTTFVEQDGRLVQRVLPHVAFRIRHVDLRGRPENDMDALCEWLGREEAAMPFDLAMPPLLRITVLQQADNRAHMLLTTHHLAGDCWANLTLVREFGEICDALAIGARPDLPDVAMQFGDFAAWQNAWLEAGGAAAAEQYWTQRLAGLSGFVTPTDRPPPAVPTRRGDIVGMMVPPQVMEATLGAARARGATFFAFGLATFSALLHRWSGHSDILVTTQVAGRDELELETVIGPFINSLALRMACEPQTRFSDLLDQTLTTVGEALENSALPFETLAGRMEQPRDGRRGPLNGVNFQVLNSAFLKDTRAGEVALRGFPSLSPGAKRDLDVYLVEREVGWRAQCEYDPDLFDAETVTWLVNTFVSLLAAVSADPARTLAELPFAPPARRQDDAEARKVDARPSAHSGQMRAASMPVETLPVEMPAAPPPDAAEQAERLRTIWRAAVRSDDPPPRASFFELGGDSMRAARLIARIHDEFGKRLGLARFFQNPTLAGVAAQLGIELASAPVVAPAPDDDDDWRIMEVSPRGSRTPVIGINSVETLFALARDFGEDRHIFGVRLFEPGKPHGIDGKTFQQIAADYIEVIRAVEPKGPYILFGLCVHGVLALEIAQQLRDAGDEVELVCFVNAWHPSYCRRLNFLNRQLVRLHDVSWNLRRVFRREKTFVEFLGNYRLAHSSGLLNLGARLGLISRMPTRTGSEFNDDFLLALMKARDAYEPRAFKGPVMQFLGPDTPKWPGLDRALGWTPVITGPIQVRYTPPVVEAGPGDRSIAYIVEHFGRMLPQ